jgi:hypothetical protein
MNRKKRRKDQTYIGKSFWRKIAKENLPEEGKVLFVYTKYGKHHFGVYKHPQFFIRIPGLKKLMPFGKNEITKWEYNKFVTDNSFCNVEEGMINEG